MRIISGEFRGRRVNLPKGVAARPTSDRVRESLFSMLHARVQSARILDLFAGSGVFGMEALSRGADYVRFCDKDRRTAHAITQHLETFGADASSYDVTNIDYDRMLTKLIAKGEQFDLVYLDPPYQSDYYEKALARLDELVEDGGLVLCETERRRDLPKTVGHLRLNDRRMYGHTAICIYVMER